jgi:hypothetical protein
MKIILLTLLLTIATSPAYALTHRQKQHQHWLMLQQQHREFQLLKKWMGEAEM